MAPLKDLACWEIMHCDGSVTCPARQNPDRPCWEIVRDLEDHRAEFDICGDCLVFVVKSAQGRLSRSEVDAIATHRGICPLAPQPAA